MPTPAWMTIEGLRQGIISQGAGTQDSIGQLSQEAHINEILVLAFQHQILVPRDKSGLPTGTRVHQPLVITKPFDKASPLLYNALTTSERMTKLVIRWWRPASDGTLQHYFTHELQDAIIVDIEAYMPNCQDPAMGHFTELEDVSFVYRKILWTHEAAGTSGSDDWRSPKA